MFVHESTTESILVFHESQYGGYHMAAERDKEKSIYRKVIKKLKPLA